MFSRACRVDCGYLKSNLPRLSFVPAVLVWNIGHAWCWLAPPSSFPGPPATGGATALCCVVVSNLPGLTTSCRRDTAYLSYVRRENCHVDGRSGVGGARCPGPRAVPDSAGAPSLASQPRPQRLCRVSAGCRGGACSMDRATALLAPCFVAVLPRRRVWGGSMGADSASSTAAVFDANLVFTITAAQTGIYEKLGVCPAAGNLMESGGLLEMDPMDWTSNCEVPGADSRCGRQEWCPVSFQVERDVPEWYLSRYPTSSIPTSHSGTRPSAGKSAYDRATDPNCRRQEAGN